MTTEVIQRLRDAQNLPDLDAFVACFDPQYRSEQPVHPRRAFVGSRQVRSNWAEVFAGVPDFHAELLRSARQGDIGWAEWHRRGTRTDGTRLDMREVTTVAGWRADLTTRNRPGGAGSICTKPGCVEGAGMAPRRQKIVTVQRLMGVIDDPNAVTSATRSLAQAGFPPEAMTVLLGNQDADRIDSLGKQSGLWKKLWRAVQFTQTDQMVDLVVYEAALRDGRAVVTVHTPRAEDRERAKRVLAAAGAHFMNFFGRLSTEDISRWRGKEPPRHPNLYR